MSALVGAGVISLPKGKDVGEFSFFLFQVLF